MLKVQILFLLFLLSAPHFFAQETLLLEGRIIDDNNVPFAFVSVKVKDTARGTVADDSGNYRLECKMGDIIQLNFVGCDPIEWVVSEDKKNFVMKYKNDNSDFYRESFYVYYPHNFYTNCTYSFDGKNVGLSFGYRCNFAGFVHNSSRLARILFSPFSMSINYAKPDWVNDDLFFPEIEYMKYIPIKINDIYPFVFSAGAGYYWNIDRGLKLKSGDYTFSVKLQLWSIPRIGDKNIRLSFWGGYQWFTERHKSDYLSFGITYSPDWYVKK